MSACINTTPGTSRIEISGDLTIYTVAALAPELVMLIFRNDPLDLSLANVHEIDAAGVQLLILAKKEAAMRGKSLRLVEHSRAVVDALELCNLFAFFGDPVLIEHRGSHTQEHHTQEQRHVS